MYLLSSPITADGQTFHPPRAHRSHQTVLQIPPIIILGVFYNLGVIAVMKLREGCYDVVGRKVELDEGEGVILEVVQTVQLEVDDGGAGEVFGAARSGQLHLLAAREDKVA